MNVIVQVVLYVLNNLRIQETQEHSELGKIQFCLTARQNRRVYIDKYL